MLPMWSCTWEQAQSVRHSGSEANYRYPLAMPLMGAWLWIMYRAYCRVFRLLNFATGFCEHGHEFLGSIKMTTNCWMHASCSRTSNLSFIFPLRLFRIVLKELDKRDGRQWKMYSCTPMNVITGR
jgi:hypothetical protein